MSEYSDFLNKKTHSASKNGFEPVWMPDFLFPFQKSLVEWSLEQGRSALFADCGLGKTPMQLVWAENVVRKTNGKVLILTPLAVSAQTKLEGEKFGIDCEICRDGNHHKNIIITNYERIHYFNPDDFIGCVCDESSAIKAFDGKRRKQVTRFMSKIQYRLLCTATAAPNDFVELGTSSEALGVLSQSEMIDQFFMSSDKARHTLFKDGDFWNKNKYFFKPHAETMFWRWVCSWGRALQKPSDIGFDDDGFVLKPLNVVQHVVEHDHLLPGNLFVVEARTLAEQRVERKITMTERCEKVAELVDHKDFAIVWCQYNAEGDFLEKAIPDSIQIAGCQSDDEKEAKFISFAKGQSRVLICKPKIGAWGLNFQHCNHVTFFPSHSFEQYYQGVRRCWRFGQDREVNVDIVTTKGESGVTGNLMSKEAASTRMFEALVREMNNSYKIDLKNIYTKTSRRPKWDM